jgi:hypothetical protein
VALTFAQSGLFAQSSNKRALRFEIPVLLGDRILLVIGSADGIFDRRGQRCRGEIKAQMGNVRLELGNQPERLRVAVELQELGVKIVRNGGW